MSKKSCAKARGRRTEKQARDARKYAGEEGSELLIPISFIRIDPSF
jgi:hypothetical protein